MGALGRCWVRSGAGGSGDGTAVAPRVDTEEQRREDSEEGERGAVGLHPPTFPLSKRQGRRFSGQG